MKKYHIGELHPESQYRSRYIRHLILSGDKLYLIEEHIH